MKNISFLAVALFSLLTLSLSCKKSNNAGSSYFITATINGTAKSFATMPFAHVATNLGITLVGISGGVSNTEPIDISVANIPSGQPIVAGTYSDTSTSFVVEALYSPKSTSGVSYNGGSNEDGSNSGLGNSAPGNHFKVVITSITSTEIKGTFGGNVYLNGDPASTVLAITNGSFYVKFQ
ncbi:MAG: hypothetical protein Q8927_01300 [Bacteroidota bacterium]|nr:hypothetical protein [Bacteroidota bacterium]MDP4214805.1 hypothetical protein [Bacteroidota bacterium]MDP4246826.1 hypothetical protein [Bacteroidota bacterium]MDP4255982.1 hypothetical protein [Bacteroidota bacterium]MDP4259003.1 hypothetical protein [Bacteroidota bacterium]